MLNKITRLIPKSRPTVIHTLNRLDSANKLGGTGLIAPVIRICCVMEQDR